MSANTPLSEDKAALVKDALFRGQKIEAIKIYRESTGAGLADAKTEVEKIEADLRIASPEKFPTPASSGGCFGVILVLAVLLAVSISGCGTKPLAEIKAGDDISEARKAYEAAGAKEVKIPLRAPQVNPQPNQTAPARYYDYVAYKYKERTVVIYSLDGKVTSVVRE